MTSPYYAAPTPAKPTSTTVHPVAPPPQNSTLVRNVAIILTGYVTVEAMIEGIEVLLVPFGIAREAITAALGLANRGTSPRPRTRLSQHGLTPTDDGSKIPRAAAANDLYFRAAYLVNAARRIQEALDNGEAIRVALSNEAQHYVQHEQARQGRLDAAGRVGTASEVYGPLLGWYLDPDLNNEAECIAANGHNFYAAEGTVIGYPGAVHPHCGCTAGPPHEGAGLVNDAVRPFIRRVGSAQIFKLKRKAS